VTDGPKYVLLLGGLPMLVTVAGLMLLLGGC
jgi:hypothetical protein